MKRTGSYKVKKASKKDNKKLVDDKVGYARAEAFHKAKIGDFNGFTELVTTPLDVDTKNAVWFM